MPFASAERPKPGCAGAITSACFAIASTKRSAPQKPMCGCRNSTGRPRPRRTISMSRPPIFSMLAPSISIHLDVRLADHPAPALVLAREHSAERRIAHRRGIGALLLEQRARVGILEHRADPVVQLREHRPR